MSNTPSLSVLYPTLNGGQQFIKSLEQVRAQSYGGDVEILVCDSGSTDGTPDRASELGATVWRIPNSEFDHGATRNALASRASGEVLVFMVQDAEPADADWLGTLVSSLLRPEVAASFSRQLPRTWSRGGNAAFLRSVYGPEPFELVKSWEDGLPTLTQIFFSNVGSAMRRETAQQFPFVEGLTMSEDQAFSKQVLESGFTVRYEASAALVHDNGHGWRATFHRNQLSASSLKGLCELGLSNGSAVSRLLRTVREADGLVGKLDTVWLESAKALGFAYGRMRLSRSGV